MYFGQRPQQYAQRGPPADNAELRRKEEQRRRQQEYAQALAQQVAQREQQKQRERELDRQAGGGGNNHAAYHQRGNFNAAAGPLPPPTANAEQQRGFFDGLGQNDNKARTSFARGQRQPEQPPQWQQQQQQEQQAYYQHQQGRPPSAMNYAPPYGQQPQVMAHQYDAGNPWGAVNNTSQWPTPSEYYQLPPQHSLAGREEYPAQQQFQQDRASPARDAQPAWFPPDAGSGFNANGFGSSAPAYPLPPSPVRDPQQQQQPQQFGRRVRTDINGGGENRKMHQQLELQSALQLQIDEKNRQKLEAKRRKEEEDRREMERLAAEQRAHELEQERLRDEKRRRAEEEAARAQQAAAAVALADQKARAEQQQRFHAAQQREEAPIRSAAPVGRFSPPKNPFVDSRAHLFQDSSTAQLPGHMSSPSIAQHPSPVSQFPGNNAGYSGNQSPGNRSGSQWPQPVEHFQQQQGGSRYSPGRSGQAGAFHPHSHQATTAWQSREMGRGLAGGGAPPVDPTVLMRQYDDMRQELARQQQLMDQLHRAQSELQHRIQQQQQQQENASSPGRSSVPTLTDLDRLRDELREELVLREQMHRRELEALKRAHQQQQQQQAQQSSDGNSLREQTVLVPIAAEQVPETDRLHTDSAMLLRTEDQAAPTVRRQHEPVTRVGTARGSHRHSERATASGPGILKSLDCDSKLVYFNGAVLHEKEAPSKPDDRGGKRVVLEPLEEEDGEELDADPSREELSDSVDELVASSTSIRPLRLCEQSAGDDSGGNQELNSSRTWIEPIEPRSKVHTSNNNRSKSPLSKAQRSPTTRPTREADQNSDDALEFFVRSFPSPVRPSRYGRASYSNEAMTRSDGGLESEAVSHWQISSLQATNESDSEEDDASMDGEQLEALFQRNVRRHEILLGFQQRARAGHSPAARSSVEPTRLAWTELRQQLEANREATRTDLGGRKGARSVAEAALVGSSRWMPSTMA